MVMGVIWHGDIISGVEKDGMCFIVTAPEVPDLKRGRLDYDVTMYLSM
jgi:hypothetical protein